MTKRLDRLISLLQRREDVASAAKARSARAAADAASRLDEARQVQRDVTAMSGHLTPVELQSLRLRGLGAAAVVERAEEALEDRRAEDVDAERERSVAAVRRRSVERLAERRQITAVRTAAAASQRALDELAALRTHDSLRKDDV